MLQPRTSSSYLLLLLAAAVGLARGQLLETRQLQQQLPKLDTDTEKGLSLCTKVLKVSTPDEQTWYTYFSCVEKELFKHKVVSAMDVEKSSIT